MYDIFLDGAKGNRTFTRTFILFYMIDPNFEAIIF